jgi:hypothetical protein
MSWQDLQILKKITNNGLKRIVPKIYLLIEYGNKKMLYNFSKIYVHSKDYVDSAERI